MKTYTHNHTERLAHTRDTKPLLQMLGLLYQVIGRCSPASDYFARYARQARKTRRMLDGFKRHNWRVTVKWGMLRTKRLRDQVLADLGGEDALLKWELRATEAHQKGAVPSKTVKHRRVTPNPDTTHKPPQVKTDRLGLFRLAPIVRPKPDREPPFRGYDWEIKDRMATIVPRPVDLKAVFEGCHMDAAGEFQCEDKPDIDNMKPIPLLPDELRGEGIEISADLNARYEALVEAKRSNPLRLEYHPQAPVVTEIETQVSEPVYFENIHEPITLKPP